MNLNGYIENWAMICEELSQDEYDELFTTQSQKYTDVFNKIDRLSDGSKFGVISWLMLVIERAFKTQEDFETFVEELQNNRAQRMRLSSLQKEILGAISQSIKINNYKDTEEQSEMDNGNNGQSENTNL